MNTPARTRIATEAARDVTSLAIDGSQRTGKWKGATFQAALLFCIFIAVATLLTLIIWSMVRGSDRLDLNLITQMGSTRRSQTGVAGYLPAILGSLWLMLGLIITAVPLGASAAIYLEEFAPKDKWYVKFIELNIQNLAAVPSVVFGILGLSFIVRSPFSLGPVILAGSLTLALLVLPTVIVTSREAIRSVPDSIRQASMGLGATKWRTIWSQVLPVSIPGIITGTILAVSRAIGEAAPLIMIGAAFFVTDTPTGLFDRFTALPLQIYAFSTSSIDEFKVLAAAGVVLLVALLLMLNSVAIWIRAKLTKTW